MALGKIMNFCHDRGAGNILEGFGKLNHPAFAEFVFSNDEVRIEVERIIKPFVNVFYRDALKRIYIDNPKGCIVIVEWAQLAEMHMGSWTNHNVIVVDSPDRQIFAERRGLSASDLEKRNKVQLSADQKIDLLRKAGSKQNNIIRYENRIDPGSEPIKKLRFDVFKLFGQG